MVLRTASQGPGSGLEPSLENIDSAQETKASELLALKSGDIADLMAV
jgi:hypothetical protein